jgi:hypothetical protein
VFVPRSFIVFTLQSILRLTIVIYKQRNAKQCQQTPETRKGNGGLFPIAIRESIVLLTSCLWTSTFWTCEIHFYYFKPSSFEYFVMADLGN